MFAVMVGSLSLGEAEDTQIHTHNCRDGGQSPGRISSGGKEGVLLLRWEGRRGRLEIQPIEGTQPADTENTQMEKSKTFMKPHTHSAGMTGAGLEDKQAVAPELGYKVRSEPPLLRVKKGVKNPLLRP